MAKYKLEVIVNVDLLSRANLGAAKIGTLTSGTYIATQKSGDMYYIDTRKGWVYAGASVSNKIKVASSLVENTETAKPAIPLMNFGLQTQQQAFNQLISGNISLGDVVKSSLEKMLEDQSSSTAKFDGSMRLFGQPFQFTKSTDPRIHEDLDLGRKYVETFIGEAPIAYIMPGRASYLPELNEEEKGVFEEAFNDSKISKTITEDILKAEQRFFDFIPDYSGYMDYVNAMCRVGAAMMGIGELEVPVIKGKVETYRFYNWANYKYTDNYTPTDSGKDVFTIEKAIDEKVQTLTEAFETWFQGFQYIQFYVDPGSSFQESGSNNSGTSAVQSLLEKAQGAVKEISFMGAAASSATGIPDAINGTKDVVSSAMDAFSAGIFSKILTNTNVIIDGGNMQFPEIWGDSSYNKSYNITVNLVSPYGDKESIYLHVLVPLFHLMALAMPRQISANGYGQPFFVKVSSKGWFNCELGVVESISLEKVMGSFSSNGLPTEMRVDLSIKDLYPNIMISSSKKPGQFFENKALLNWLAITCGLDITKPTIVEKWGHVLTALVAGSVIDIPGNIYERTLERTRNMFRNLLGFNM